MKIIAVGMNYAAHNKELHHSLELSEPTIFMKSDSSLLKDGKPFFIPDFSSEVHYETEIVVRIDRLGKNIASFPFPRCDNADDIFVTVDKIGRAHV